jgi:hypothetical protein
MLTWLYSIVSPLFFDNSTMNRDGATSNTWSHNKEQVLDTCQEQQNSKQK